MSKKKNKKNTDISVHGQIGTVSNTDISVHCTERVKIWISHGGSINETEHRSTVDTEQYMSLVYGSHWPCTQVGGHDS